MGSNDQEVPSSSVFLWGFQSRKIASGLGTKQVTFDCCDLGFKQLAYMVICISHPSEIIVVGRGRNALGKQARLLGEVIGVKQQGEKSGIRD